MAQSELTILLQRKSIVDDVSPEMYNQYSPAVVAYTRHSLIEVQMQIVLGE